MTTETTTPPDPVEDLAKGMGWRPKSEFRGDPNLWKPADEYIKAGADIQKGMSRDLKDLRSTMDTMTRTNAAIVKSTIDAEREKLVAKYNQAVDDGDAQSSFQIGRQIDHLNGQAANLAQPTGRHRPRPRPTRGSTATSGSPRIRWRATSRWPSPSNMPRPVTRRRAACRCRARGEEGLPAPVRRHPRNRRRASTSRAEGAPASPRPARLSTTCRRTPRRWRWTWSSAEFSPTRRPTPSSIGLTMERRHKA